MEVSTIRDIKPHDELSTFLVWFFEVRPFFYVPSKGGLNFVDGAHTITLYRVEDKQVQMILMDPDIEIPEHVHPNVDSYEVALNGMTFTHSGQELVNYATDQEVTEAGLYMNHGLCVRVKPNDLHGGNSSPDGAVFISVQHWLNGVTPTSVEKDWEGDTLGAAHASTIIKN